MEENLVELDPHEGGDALSTSALIDAEDDASEHDDYTKQQLFNGSCAAKKQVFCDAFTDHLVQGILRLQAEVHSSRGKTGARAKRVGTVADKGGSLANKVAPGISLAVNLATYGLRRWSRANHYHAAKERLNALAFGKHHEGYLRAFVWGAAFELSHILEEPLSHLTLDVHGKGVRRFAQIAAERWLHCYQPNDALTRDSLINGVLTGKNALGYVGQGRDFKFTKDRLATENEALDWTVQLFDRLGVRCYQLQQDPCSIQETRYRPFSMSDESHSTGKYGYRGEVYGLTEHLKYRQEGLSEDFAPQGSRVLTMGVQDQTGDYFPEYIYVYAREIVAYMNDEVVGKEAGSNVMSFNEYLSQKYTGGHRALTAICISGHLSDRAIRGGNFSGSVFKTIGFTGMDLTDCCFQHCVLQESDFSGATLDNTDFSGARLSFTNWTGIKAVNKGANFTHSRLHYAVMHEAAWGKSRFHGADIAHSDVDKADFSEADTTQLKTDGCNIDEAEWKTDRSMIQDIHKTLTRSPPGRNKVSAVGVKVGLFTGKILTVKTKDDKPVDAAAVRAVNPTPQQLDQMMTYAQNTDVSSVAMEIGEINPSTEGEVVLNASEARATGMEVTFTQQGNGSGEEDDTSTDSSAGGMKYP